MRCVAFIAVDIAARMCHVFSIIMSYEMSLTDECYRKYAITFAFLLVLSYCSRNLYRRTQYTTQLE